MTATVRPLAYMAGDAALQKLTVIRILLERLFDELEEIELLTGGAGDLDRVELHDKVGSAMTLAAVCLDEVTPLEAY